MIKIKDFGDLVKIPSLSGLTSMWLWNLCEPSLQDVIIQRSAMLRPVEERMDHFDPLSREEAASWVMQLLLGSAHTHGEEVVHRDI